MKNRKQKSGTPSLGEVPGGGSISGKRGLGPGHRAQTRWRLGNSKSQRGEMVAGRPAADGQEQGSGRIRWRRGTPQAVWG